MNRREKMMMGALGAVLLLLAVSTVKKQYVAKLNELDQTIAKKKQDLDKIQNEQLRLAKGKRDWAQAGRQTLALDESEAMTLFRPDIDALVQEVGLTGGAQIRGVTKFGKYGLRTLSCSVTAQGQLRNILEFLFKVHQRPYAIRCDNLRCQQVIAKDVPKNTLRMTIDLDTLLLPAGKVYDLPKVFPVDLASTQPAEPIVRTKFAKLDDYLDIAKRKVFESWTPPIPPPGKVAGFNPGPSGQINIGDPQMRWSPAANAKTYVVYFGEENPPPETTRMENATQYRSPKPLEEGKKYYLRVDSINSEGVKTDGDVIFFTGYKPVAPPPVADTRPPPPPADANLVLARIVSSPRGQQAVLEDPANKNAEDKRVEVGDPFHGGTLVLVSTKGAVSEKEGRLYYHPLTRPLHECQPLTEDTQPLLLDEVMKLEQRAKGISQGLGSGSQVVH